MESAGSVDSMGASSGESLGIRVLLSSSLRQFIFEMNDDSLLLSILCLKYLNISVSVLSFLNCKKYFPPKINK
jgi:hypothetical protein